MWTRRDFPEAYYDIDQQDMTGSPRALDGPEGRIPAVTPIFRITAASALQGVEERLGRTDRAAFI
jgi:hypothetical protein